MYYGDVFSHVGSDDYTLVLDEPLECLSVIDSSYSLDENEGSLTYEHSYYLNPKLKGVEKHHWSNCSRVCGTLSEFPNCCGILIASGCNSNSESIAVAIELARRMGYTLLLYAASDTQTTHLSTLTKLGFKLDKASQFKNIRTDNVVSMYSLILQE